MKANRLGTVFICMISTARSGEWWPILKRSGKNILERIIKQSDALEENYRQNVKKRVGSAYEDIKPSNPSVYQYLALARPMSMTVHLGGCPVATAMRVVDPQSQRRSTQYYDDESHEETLMRGGDVLGTFQSNSPDQEEMVGQPGADNVYNETCKQF